MDYITVPRGLNLGRKTDLVSSNGSNLESCLYLWLELIRKLSGPHWLVRFPNPLAFGSGLGERTPKKAIFQLWRSVSQSKKILHQKAQQNWNQSSMTFKFCQFETILKVSSGHCGPLTPFLQFRQLLLQSGQIYWVTFFNWISPGAANHISPALFLA